MANVALIFLTPLIQNAISKATSFAGAQISLAWGLKKHLQELAQTLIFIQGVLQTAEERQESNQAVRIWLQQLNDVAYEVEDALDEYAYELLRRKVQSQRRKRKQVRGFISFHNRPAFHHIMANKIRKINQSLVKIKENEGFVQLIGLGEQSCPTTSARQYFKTDSILDCSKIVGRHDDVLKIVNILDNMRSQHLLSCISMVGLGGIGKTTLAKSVCEMAKEQKLYDLVAWVCVSENFDEQIILREMLGYIDSSAGKMNMDALIQKLGKGLENKNFLLVLDDVWNEERDKWDSFESRLSKISKTTGNSILVTTRSVKVVSLMERLPMHKHDMQKLSDDEYWLIIEDIILRSSTKTSIPLNLEGIGQNIAKHCGGLPLVASVMGGTLACEISVDKWRKIRDDKAWMLQDENKKILSVLKISFDRLSSPLKKCFSYCSIFPKDYVIEKDDLVQLWMAQGFLFKSNESLIMEDIGNQYFNELVSNSLFQDIKCDLYGNIRSCKMHDLVHDLASHVSKGETLIWDPNSNLDENSTIRHLRVESDGEVPPTIPRSIAQRLHSLFSNFDVFCSMASDLKSLRSLKLSTRGREEELRALLGKEKGLPASLNKLKHLRYLDTLRTHVDVPPQSFSKLYSLQTCKVNSLSKLPDDGANLISLRHIYSYHPFYVSIDQLTSLQTLSKFCVGTKKGYGIEELGRLSQLRGELVISHLDCVRSKFEASKAKLKEKILYRLKVQWNKDREGNVNDEEVIESLEPHSNLKNLTIENYRGKGFPSWLVRKIGCSGSSFLLNNLVGLELLYCSECTCIPSLGLLPSLKVLYIEDMAHVIRMGHKFYGRSQYNREESIILFPALKKLTMRHMKSLQEWIEVDEDAAAGGEVEIVFPCLEELLIYGCPELYTWSMGGFAFNHKLSNLRILLCPNLKAIPNMDGLSSLKRLELSDCKNRLTSLPTGLGSCTSLKELRIGAFRQDLEKFPFPRLNSDVSLESLALTGWDKLNSLPHQLQHLTTLKTLNICSFKGVKYLPEWLEKMSSLRWLEIKDCPNLISMPSLEAMGRLSNLEFLYVWDCPKLKEKWANKSSLEWSKISRIPNIRIDGRWG